MGAAPLTASASLNRSLVDRDALTELLEASGLVEQALAQQVGLLAGRFPALVQRDLFLEFEFEEEAVPAGFGLGFSAGTLDHFRVVRHPFLTTALGRSLEAAFADDPFAADHREHLNLFGDSDPDWVEYDVCEGRVAATPFVFFRLPSRLRCLAGPEDVRELCAILPGRATNGDFERLLDRIVAGGSACPYRIGVAKSRGAGWWRAIITDIDCEQVVAALEGLGADNYRGPLELASRLYQRGMDRPGACFALSIDVHDDRITAVDVECPFLFRIADPNARAGPLSHYAREITAIGILSAATAAWIEENVVRDVTMPHGGPSLRIMLHHLKFRLFGEPHLRTKAYLHLGLGSDPVATPSA